MVELFYNKEFLGALAVVIGLLSFVPFFRGMHKRIIKPHAFSWIIWSILTGVGYVAQVTDNAGPGAWVTGISTLLCIVIAILSLFVGEKRITRSDWVTFFMALATIPVWMLTGDLFWSVLLCIVIDGMGYYPTIRKSWVRPFEETSLGFHMGWLKYVPALMAMENFTFLTASYPLFLLCANLITGTMIDLRRVYLRRMAAQQGAGA